MASNAVHHRIDCLTSIVALIAITGSRLYGVTWLDPVGGLIVSMMVIRAGWGNTRAALLELADVGIDAEVKGSVRKAALKAIATDLSSAELGSNKVEVRDVQGVKAGQNYLIDIVLAVSETCTLAETRGVEDAIRKRVGSKVQGIRRVKIRFVSKESGKPGFSDEFIGEDIYSQSSPEPEDEEEARHEHADHHQSSNRNLRKRH